MARYIDLENLVNRKELTIKEVGYIRRSFFTKFKQLKALVTMYKIDNMLALPLIKSTYELFQLLRKFTTSFYYSSNEAKKIEIEKQQDNINFEQLKELIRYGKFYEQLGMSQYELLENFNNFINENQAFNEYIINAGAKNETD